MSRFQCAPITPAPLPVRQVLVRLIVGQRQLAPLCHHFPPKKPISKSIIALIIILLIGTLVARQLEFSFYLTLLFFVGYFASESNVSWQPFLRRRQRLSLSQHFTCACSSIYIEEGYSLEAQ